MRIKYLRPSLPFSFHHYRLLILKIKAGWRVSQGYVVSPEAFASLAGGRERMLIERDIGKGGSHEKQTDWQRQIRQAIGQGWNFCPAGICEDDP